MIRLGLDSIRYLCEKLNNPQDKLSFIHVAGTNGKGSTSAFIASILREAKLKVGVYSSPAVFKEEEIIRVNDRNISKADYEMLEKEVNNACYQMAEEGKDEPTPFEKQTAIAFLYFVMKECDIVVLECGMGGETDATNIIKNTVACAFTSIAMDHMDYLGDSLHKISKVKAGIIKDGALVYTSNTDKDIVSAIEENASKHNTSVNIIQCDKHLKSYITLKGNHQIENASLAVAVVRGLNSLYDEGKFAVRITDKNIENGLHKTKMPGRFEIIHNSPTIIIDGAHNEGAARILKDNIMSTYKNKKIFYIVGMLVNKDHKSVLSEVIKDGEHVFTVSTIGERGYSANSLAEEAYEFNKNVSAIGGIEEALDIANLMASNKDLIVVFGSFSFLKEAKEWVKK